MIEDTKKSIRARNRKNDVGMLDMISNQLKLMELKYPYFPSVSAKYFGMYALTEDTKTR